MIEVVLNDRLGKKVRVKCKCALNVGTYVPDDFLIFVLPVVYACGRHRASVLVRQVVCF